MRSALRRATAGHAAAAAAASLPAAVAAAMLLAAIAAAVQCPTTLLSTPTHECTTDVPVSAIDNNLRSSTLCCLRGRQREFHPPNANNMFATRSDSPHQRNARVTRFHPLRTGTASSTVQFRYTRGATNRTWETRMMSHGGSTVPKRVKRSFALAHCSVRLLTARPAQRSMLEPTLIRCSGVRPPARRRQLCSFM